MDGGDHEEWFFQEGVMGKRWEMHQPNGNAMVATVVVTLKEDMEILDVKP